MEMSSSERDALLSRWIKPSSDDEQVQQDRAVRMVIDAINGHVPLTSAAPRVFAKGSYPNNTNVRRDSDVDIAVQCSVAQYYDHSSFVTPPTQTLTPYIGEWTPPSTFRAAVESALVNKFGRAAVDSSGAIAITIAPVPGSRPSIDVVPSYNYRLYDDATNTRYREGSCVWPKTGNSKIVNWPDQQLQNGRARNQPTGQRYKNYVRALKNAENTLATAGTIPELPSYFMECLVWNTPDEGLRYGTLSSGFRQTLAHLWQGLADGGGYDAWVEPNKNKYLFGPRQKWTREQAQELVLATWNYLDY